MSLYQQLYAFQFLALFLLGCGVVGLIYRRTLIGMLISVELILNGAGLNLVAADHFLAEGGMNGQVFTLFIMGVAASEAAVALGIIIYLFRRVKGIESERLKELKG